MTKMFYEKWISINSSIKLSSALFEIQNLSIISKENAEICFLVRIFFLLEFHQRNVSLQKTFSFEKKK